MAAAATASYIPSSAPPAYETSSEAYPVYPESTPVYEASSTPAYPAYPESTPAYGVSSSAEYPAYPVSSKAEEYPSYPTTKVVTGISTYCSETGVYTYGTKTYVVTEPTTIVDYEYEYTTTYEVSKPTGYPVHTPVHSEYAPSHYVPAPSSNGTHPTGYVKPSQTKPVTPEYTGAAGKASVGLLAIVGAVAAFL